MSRDIARWRGTALGRSRTVAHGGLVWTVANARSTGAGFVSQVDETLSLLDQSLQAAGTSRERLLSVQVLLGDMADYKAFDERWCAWIGGNPEHWPQRAVYGAALVPGLGIEVIATAATGGVAV